MSQEVIKIKGGKKLNGKVQISGAKNSAVALIPASLMANDVVTLDGLPDISDVKTLMSLLGDLNIKTELNGDQIVVDSSDAVNLPLPNNKVQSLRASYYMMGAKIRGAGTDTLKIEGVENLHGTNHSIIPDRIEAGTYMCAAAAMGEEVLIENIIPLHLEPLIAKLKEMGTEIELGEDSIIIRGRDEYKPVDIQTSVYPGFATDLQQPFTPLLLKAKGQSKVVETIYPARFKHVDELLRMGAKVNLENGTAIYYPSKLTGASVAASDLRAGASLLIAGLIAEDVTTVYNVNHIYRGYSGIVDKLKHLGADIWTEEV